MASFSSDRADASTDFLQSGISVQSIFDLTKTAPVTDGVAGFARHSCLWLVNGQGNFRLVQIHVRIFILLKEADLASSLSAIRVVGNLVVATDQLVKTLIER
jgi:hypothetical protein